MRYRYFISDKKVVCVTSYAGKSVRGIAQCSPEDNFDEEYGKQLARARADLKVAEKRQSNYEHRYVEAIKEAEKAMFYRDTMYRYWVDASDEVEYCRYNLDNLELKATPEKADN